METTTLLLHKLSDNNNLINQNSLPLAFSDINYQFTRSTRNIKKEKKKKGKNKLFTILAPKSKTEYLPMKIHDRWNFIWLSFRARPAGININFHCRVLFTTRCRSWRSRFIPEYRAAPFNKFRTVRQSVITERENRNCSLW